MSIRPKKVAAGQADGIQPRTIEVLQVSELVMDSYVGIETIITLFRVMDWRNDYLERGTKCIWLFVSSKRHTFNRN